MDNLTNCGDNCCLCVFVEIMKHYGVQVSDEMKKMCTSLGSGLGIGGICGALLAGIIAAGYLCGDDFEKARLCIMNDFSSSFKTLNCSGLSLFRDSDGGCEKIMRDIIEISEKYISLFYHGSL
ncbi:MAG: C-GCAxxG-C-C family protein [Clostridia bacterium]|jgi:C_GCAxxG_C_C family probable redox protein|nr:C-GCAxxG-C-C family protein [Clostridia bacterium]